MTRAAKPALLVLVMIVCADVSAADISAVPELATPAEGVPAGGVVSEVTTDESWAGSHSLVFRARLTKRHSSKVWLHVRFKGTNGWCYIAVNTAMLVSARWTDVEVDLTETSSAWSPSGHRRPFDRFALAHVTEVSIESSLTETCSGNIVIENVSLSSRRLPWWSGRTRVVEIELPYGEARTDSVSELRFRLNPPPDNPFDPELDILGIIQGPGGRAVMVPAFYGQDFEERSGRLSPVGAGYWGLRFRPSLSGQHWLVVKGKGETEFATGRLPFEVKPALDASRGPSLEDKMPEVNVRFFLKQIDRSYSFCHRLSGNPSEGLRWEGASDFTPAPAWNAPLTWGNGSLQRLDLETAFILDGILRQAETAGESFPFRLNGNEELHDTSTNLTFPYRWHRNPLSWRNDGILRRPSDYFRSDEARKIFERDAAYACARWGAFRSVSGFVLANDTPADGAFEWHREVAGRLHRLSGDKPVYTLHPEAAVPPDGRSPCPFSFSRTSTYGTRMTFEAREKPDLSVADLTAFDISLPDNVASDMRAVVALKDSDGWWHQVDPAPFLRPGDTTRLILDISDGAAISSRGHERPWNGFTRTRIQRLFLYIFGKDASSRDIRVSTAYVSRRAAPSGPPRVERISLPPQGASVGEVADITCQLDRWYANPFDPAVIDVSATFTSPDGTEFKRPAFFYQNYREPDRNEKEGTDGTRETTHASSTSAKRPAEAVGKPRPVPVGKPCWKIRFRPRQTGQHRFSITLRDRYGQGTGPEITLDVRRSRRKKGKRKEFSSPYLLTQHDFSYDSMSWFSKGGWIRERFDPERPDRSSMAAWYPLLEWTGRWGGYHGAGSYNLAGAWEVDRSMQKAVSANCAFPLRLNGNQEFANRRNHRWPDNPLSKANGGPLQAPNSYFSDPATTRMQRNLFRYMAARWGDSPAVSNLLLAHDMPAEGAEKWHLDTGTELAAVYTGGTLASVHPQAIPLRKRRALSGFERWGKRWKPDLGIPDGKYTRVLCSSEWASRPKGPLMVSRVFPDKPSEAAIYYEIDEDWFDYDTLAFDVKLPKKAPPDMRVMVYMMDGDLWWYERLLKPCLLPGDTTKLLADLTPGGKWRAPPPESDSPWNHSKPWTDFDRTRIRRLGLRFFGHKAYDGPIYVDNVELWSTREETPPAPRVVSCSANRESVGLYERLELTLKFDGEFRNPFDQAEADVRATFVSPSGRVHQVPAFYYQDYKRKKVELRCPTHNKIEPFEALIPAGAPCWKVRFSPTEKGTYNYMITLKGKREWPKEGKASFEAKESNRQGFVRVSADGRHFEFSNGSFYYPIGLNFRSPTDLRNKQFYDFEQAWHDGTYLYDEYFKRMQANGVNWARIWMCSWWLGLEWYGKWPGYHGLGRYNLENAWRMDHLLEEAERRDVYLQIDTTNHGQLSLKIDTEWEHNPLNRQVGGFLDMPRQFFRQQDAMKAYRDRIRYTLARWGYSPNVFSWIILTEVEFVDDYFVIAYPRQEAGRHPIIADWHRRAAAVFKHWDPNHIVSTHFSHPWRGADIWELPTIEFVESNAYWQNWKFKEKTNDTIHILDRCIRPDGMLSRYSKPVLIGEYGGGVFKNPPQRLEAQLHAGTWAMAMMPYAGSCGYWWWPFVHYKDKYGHYAALSRFMKGEDRRGKNLKQIRPEVSGGLEALGLMNDTCADIWVYSPGTQLDLKQPVAVRGATLTLSGLRNARYKVEFWDTYQGKVTSVKNIAASDGKMKISLPRVKPDLALKVRRPAETKEAK